MLREMHSGLRRPRGAGAVELALVMVAVVGAMFAGTWLLSHRTKQTWARVNTMQIVSFDGEPSRAVRSTGRKGSIPGSATSSSSKLTEQPSPASGNSQWQFGYLATTIGIALCAETLVLVRRRRKRTEEEESPDTDPSQLPLRLFEKRQDLLRRLSEAAYSGKSHALRIRDVMTRSVVSLGPYTPVAEVGRLMRENRVRHVLVIDDDDRLLGMISDRDLSQRIGRMARDIMSRRIISVSGDTELIPAVTTMMNRGISALPILHKECPIGILTSTDALLVLQCLLLLKHREETPVGETV